MANVSPANEARLRAAINERGLRAAEELIVASSVECATLYTLGPDDYAQTGNSRYCGVPDLPNESFWPKTAEGKFYQFFMQVNLADVPDFVGNVLPRRGMLYAFLADYDDIAKYWTILWADVSPSELRRMEPKPAEQISDWCEDEISYLPPCKLGVEASINVPEWFSLAYEAIEGRLSEMPDDAEGVSAEDRYENLTFALQKRSEEKKSRGGKLLGQPAYIGYDPNDGYDDGRGIPEDFVLLWMLDSDRAVDVTFGDAGYVQLFIHRDALKKHDFSYVFSRLESS